MRWPDEEPEVAERDVPATVEGTCRFCGHRDHEAAGCPNVPLEWLDNDGDDDEGEDL